MEVNNDIPVAETEPVATSAPTASPDPIASEVLVDELDQTTESVVVAIQELHNDLVTLNTTVTYLLFIILMIWLWSTVKKWRFVR